MPSQSPRHIGHDAVKLAKEKGWKPGVLLMSDKSWTVARIITSVETWCLRLKEVSGDSTPIGKATTGSVYKTLPQDVREVPQDVAKLHKRTKNRKSLKAPPGTVFVELSTTSAEHRLAAKLSE
jgi:hypothetical protein